MGYEAKISALWSEKGLTIQFTYKSYVGCFCHLGMSCIASLLTLKPLDTL